MGKDKSDLEIRSRMSLRFAVLSATFVSGGIVASADAGISDVAFEITATSGTDIATWQLLLDDVNYDPGDQRWHWQTNSDVELIDNSSLEVVATIKSISFEYIFDPEVSFGFEVEAGSSLTSFTISSGLMSFPTINGAEGLVTAGVLVTDTNGDGATLTGLNPGGAAYLAQYNGMVPGGTDFASTLFDPVVASPFGSASNAPGSGDFPGGGLFSPIGGPISSMSAQFSFSLTAEDLASGSSLFLVTPAPGGLAVVALALIGGRGRRRRD